MQRLAWLLPRPGPSDCRRSVPRAPAAHHGPRGRLRARATVYCGVEPLPSEKSRLSALRRTNGRHGEIRRHAHLRTTYRTFHSGHCSLTEGGHRREPSEGPRCSPLEYDKMLHIHLKVAEPGVASAALDTREPPAGPIKDQHNPDPDEIYHWQADAIVCRHLIGLHRPRTIGCHG